MILIRYSLDSYLIIVHVYFRSLPDHLIGPGAVAPPPKRSTELPAPRRSGRRVHQVSLAKDPYREG